MSATKLPKDTTSERLQTIHPGASHKIDFTASSVPSSSATSIGTSAVEIWATENCYVRFAPSPVAAVNDGLSFYVPRLLKLTYGINGGDKIAAIRDTTSGSLHVIEAAGEPA